MQGPQTFSLTVVEEAGPGAAQDVVSGRAYPVLAPDEAAAVVAALNRSFSAALRNVEGQDAEQPDWAGLRVEVGSSTGLVFALTPMSVNIAR